MSSQKGNATRSRGQKYQNSTAFRNDKYGTSVQVKKAKSKSHDGLCQHCKDVLEWKVKYNKYKSLTQARKCVKCSQKTVKDAYHIVCKPCSLKLEICCKCGKKEEIVIPINSEVEKNEKEEGGEQKKQGRGQRKRDTNDLDSDDYDDEDEVSNLGGGDEEEEEEGQDCNNDSEPKKTEKTLDGLPDVSRVNVSD